MDDAVADRHAERASNASLLPSNPILGLNSDGQRWGRRLTLGLLWAMSVADGVCLEKGGQPLVDNPGTLMSWPVGRLQQSCQSVNQSPREFHLSSYSYRQASAPGSTRNPRREELLHVSCRTAESLKSSVGLAWASDQVPCARAIPFPVAAGPRESAGACACSSTPLNSPSTGSLRRYWRCQLCSNSACFEISPFCLPRRGSAPNARRSSPV
ncbi:hypothetical protein BO78DRAFT_174648 [Aspergillus sclerotiicarbonarius CBS 121057]|uniref:Uncharacterized protein n=1 Tax=Aspergillus sclerotiicarbonarius (strain CBS 121057 / IBT 28362) TaxID=1448318 RepID=A0A319EKG5_ASPSB|nr:hypothetical protein BO78DRAFT_174648 [Aspergillus sclerotiicarbonarius CBS 121057]